MTLRRVGVKFTGKSREEGCIRLAHYIGIDIGTSAIKAVITDSAQNVVAERDAPLGISRPKPLWSEQNPADWWAAVSGVLDGFAASVPQLMGRVQAIGLSGQMHGAVLLGAALTPLRPAMLWNDARTGAQARELAIKHPHLAQRLGVMPMPGLTAPKIPWLAVHEPQILAKLHKILLPKDYIRLQLTGALVTDMSDAAGTWWLDQARRDWDDEALGIAGLSRAQMPDLVEGNAVSGYVRDDLARRWGFRSKVPVAGGGGDAAAGAVGVGAINHGDAFVSMGTSGQLYVATRDYRPAPAMMVHAFCHALPQRWSQMGAMLSAASCLTWAATMMGEDVTELAQAVEAAYAGPTSLLFLPYLTGERTPHNNPDAKGVLFGLTPDSGKLEVAQAVMEGVAFSFADAALSLAQSGTRIDRVGAIGGGARSLLWLQMLANVLDVPVVRYAASARGPAFGAARLARLCATGEAPEDICTAPPVDLVVQPDARLVAAYQPRLERYRRLYVALKGEFEG